MDMAMIQTGAPLYEELLRIQLDQEEEEEVEQKERGEVARVGRSRDGRTNTLWLS